MPDEKATKGTQTILRDACTTGLPTKNRATAYLRDVLQQRFEDAAPKLDGMWSDLLTNALDQVNWHEIAEALLEDVEEGTGDE